jgi:farnesyl-diphosphate farnesyltransferase
VSDELLTTLLRDVSRSFYLTMRMLPGAVRRPVSIAYLLARTTDTIADTELVPMESRLEALAALRGRILGQGGGPVEFLNLRSRQTVVAERILLERCEESLRLLDELEDADRRRIRDVLAIIISGQELDLKRFADASASQIVALETPEELDDYTYRVAGCVGEFWTSICRAHLFPAAPMDEKALARKGVLFGQGLQLVNVLRDLPRDLRNGRCYIPRRLLEAGGLTPGDLLSAANEARFRPVYDPLLSLAENHLVTGWDYTCSLPRWEVRLRLGCAWAVLIGARTLRLLRVENMLDSNRRIKVSRKEVRSMRARSVLLYPFPSLWNGMLAKELA